MQLLLFGRQVVYDVTLHADSKKHAFYRLLMVFEGGQYYIEKESGAGERILDRRRWPQAGRDAAEKYFNRKLEAKLKPGRKSPRQYYLPEMIRDVG